MSHLALQQSPSAAQVLPAVWQPMPICAHLPLWQALGPLQQAAPPAAQEAPSETQGAAAHRPPLQLKLQQSPPLAQVPPVGLHTEAVH
jgi:hypothetical protein